MKYARQQKIRPGSCRRNYMPAESNPNSSQVPQTNQKTSRDRRRMDKTCRFPPTSANGSILHKFRT
jgi:hypothetical protein